MSLESRKERRNRKKGVGITSLHCVFMMDMRYPAHSWDHVQSKHAKMGRGSASLLTYWTYFQYTLAGRGNGLQNFVHGPPLYLFPCLEHLEKKMLFVGLCKCNAKNNVICKTKNWVQMKDSSTRHNHSFMYSTFRHSALHYIPPNLKCIMYFYGTTEIIIKMQWQKIRCVQ